MNAIVPGARAEFRVFGQDVIARVEPRMWGARARLRQVRVMPAEIYLLSRRGSGVNVKIRAGLLDVKVLEALTPQGYEVFRPAAKHPLPASAEAIRSVTRQLGVEVDTRDGTYDIPDLLRLADAHPDLGAINVEKTRYDFEIGGVTCEYARVLFNGAAIESACCESEDHAALHAAVEALGLAGEPNVNYIEIGKRVIGLR